MIALIKKLIKRKEKVKIVFSTRGEKIIRRGREEFRIRNSDLDKLQSKIMYIYEKVRENGEILKYPEATWLITHQFLILIEKDKISIRGRGKDFEFEFVSKDIFRDIVEKISKEEDIDKIVKNIIDHVLSRFQEVLSQLK